MRRVFIVVMTMVAVMALAGPALAAPKGQGLESFTGMCDGQEVQAVASSGASFWVEGEHYVLTSFTGTFIPVEGPTETFTKTYGNRAGLTGAEIHCIVEFEEPGAGTFIADVTGVAVR